MDSVGIFWTNVWRTIATVAIVLIVITGWYNVNQNALWYDSWNKCVAAGGKPIQDTVKGTDMRSFTCERN